MPSSMIEENRFQFHKGTIKTDKLYRLQQQAGKFQFHKGTIKTYLRFGSTVIFIISIP